MRTLVLLVATVAFATTAAASGQEQDRPKPRDEAPATNAIKSTRSNKYGHGIEPNATASEKSATEGHSAGDKVTGAPTKRTHPASPKDPDK